MKIFKNLPKLFVVIACFAVIALGCHHYITLREYEYKRTSGWFDATEQDQWRKVDEWHHKNRLYQRFERPIGDHKVEVRYFYIENLQSFVVKENESVPVRP